MSREDGAASYILVLRLCMQAGCAASLCYNIFKNVYIYVVSYTLIHVPVFYFTYSYYYYIWGLQHRNRPLRAEREMGAHPDPKRIMHAISHTCRWRMGRGGSPTSLHEWQTPPSPAEVGLGGRANHICRIPHVSREDGGGL